MVFNDNAPVFRIERNKLTTVFLKKLFRAFPVDNSIISDVIHIESPIISLLKANSHYYRFSATSEIPIKNRYSTPQTLGKDRLANAIAAAFLFPKRNVLTIDVGTCVKFDFVNKKAEYLGGSISPGMLMRFNALHQFTDRLPLVKPDKIKNVVGNSTETALQSGVIIGMTEEIRGIINIYRTKYPDLIVIITGGDASRFVSQLKMSIFAATDLVNIGLNEIIRYNVED